MRYYDVEEPDREEWQGYGTSGEIDQSTLPPENVSLEPEE